MKFPVCLVTGNGGLTYPMPSSAPRGLIKASVFCAQLGYDAVWSNDNPTTQHYVGEMYAEPPNIHDGLITMAMISGATAKLRFGAGLLVMPMREPVYVARQVATLDQLSGGRFMPAVRLGAYRKHFEAWAGHRYPKPRCGDMLDEGLAAIQNSDTAEGVDMRRPRPQASGQRRSGRLPADRNRQDWLAQTTRRRPPCGDGHRRQHAGRVRAAVPMVR